MTERTASLPVTGPPMSVRVTEHEDAAVPVTGNVPGTEYDPDEVATRDVERRLYVDIDALLNGGLPEPLAPSVLNFNDGVALFYRGQVNHVFGDPESGKTWVCLAAAADELRTGRTVAVIDLDHNGPDATVARLVQLGAPVEALRSLDRFRYIEPDDLPELRATVGNLTTRPAGVVVVDSLGELLPMAGASSNDADDFTRVHSNFLKPLAKEGACVLVIDHLAKGSESRAMGASGTAAKGRAVGGLSVRVTIKEQFAPSRGGSCTLAIKKDRHGGLRKHRDPTDREPLAGTFKLNPDGATYPWSMYAPLDGERNPGEAADAALVDRLLALDELPATVAEARQVLSCQNAEAGRALKEARRSVTRTGIGGPVTGNAPDQAELL